MNHEEAKQILSAWRPNGPDTQDPFFSEALAAAASDPELSRWLADQQEMDDAMRTAIQAESAPDGLRDAILAANQIVPFEMVTDQPDSKASGDGAVTPNRLAWAHPSMWWAIAAALVLLVGSTAILLTGGNGTLTARQFADEVVEIAATGQIQLQQLGSNPTMLRTWLASNGSPHNFVIPAGLDDVNPLGCQVFEIGGRPVSLMCFKLEDGRIVHCFVIDSDDLAQPPSATPTFFDQGGLVAATWSHEGKTFVLTGSGVDRKTLADLV